MRARRVLIAMVLAMGLGQAAAQTAREQESTAVLGDLDAAAASILGRNQGVYVEAADGTVLVSRAAERAVHPASVSKVATTLALLRRFGPEHRFVTTFSARGCVLEGTLHGKLVVETDGDPSLVDEDALLVAEQLKRLGIRRIAGGLDIAGPLTFDWLSDASGTGLRRALSGATPAAAWSVVSALIPVSADAAASGLPAAVPGIQFVSGPAAQDLPSGQWAEVIYRSQPLLSLLKGLNDYSNNIFKPFADAAGGASAIETLARSAVPAAMRAEITLGDGAGEDPRNRLSPRAAVRLLRSLEQELAMNQRTLADVLPVAGVDEGTLLHRLSSPEAAGRVVGKTGTFGDYGASALVGAIRTQDRGTVYFAVLDHDVPVPEARRRQDEFVRALLGSLRTLPWDYQRDDRPAVSRADISIAPPEMRPGADCPRGS